MTDLADGAVVESKSKWGITPLLALPGAPGQRWSMDFQHDMLSSGQRFRTLYIVDELSR